MRFTNAGLFFIDEAAGPIQVALWFPNQTDRGSVWMMAHPEISKDTFPNNGLAALSVTDIVTQMYFDEQTNRAHCVYSANVTNIGNFGTFFSLQGGEV